MKVIFKPKGQFHPRSTLAELQGREFEVTSFLPNHEQNGCGPQMYVPIHGYIPAFDDEVIPLENAELPYIGNEFWFSYCGLDPKRCIVMRQYEDDGSYDFGVRLQDGTPVAAYKHELTPV